MTDFLSNLDVSQRDFVKTFAEFDPQRNKKERMPISEVTLHTTGEYYNDTGNAPEPVGAFSLLVFARGIANRFGSVLERGRGSCCAVQSVISRDTHTYLLAGMNDPVQHNPPYDSKEFGIEIEAPSPPAVTTEQWEEGGKLSLLKLRLAGNNDPYLLVSLIKGHGQRRQELYNEYLTTEKWKNDPRFPTLEVFKIKYPYKGDVLGPESELFRQKLLQSLLQYPELMTMPLPNLN